MKFGRKLANCVIKAACLEADIKAVRKRLQHTTWDWLTGEVRKPFTTEDKPALPKLLSWQKTRGI